LEELQSPETISPPVLVPWLLQGEANDLRRVPFERRSCTRRPSACIRAGYESAHP